MDLSILLMASGCALASMQFSALRIWPDHAVGRGDPLIQLLFRDGIHTAQVLDPVQGNLEFAAKPAFMRLRFLHPSCLSAKARVIVR